jgi:hypothetical protein
MDDGVTRINVWKCRFKWLGKLGDAFIHWDPATGRFSDSGDHAASVLGDVDWDAIEAKKEEANAELF